MGNDSAMEVIGQTPNKAKKSNSYLQQVGKFNRRIGGIAMSIFILNILAAISFCILIGSTHVTHDFISLRVKMTVVDDRSSNLEARPKSSDTAEAADSRKRSVEEKNEVDGDGRVLNFRSGKDATANDEIHQNAASIEARSETSASRYNVPFVFTVHKRVNYLRQAIETLRQSDFPKESVPIIISHDGHVPEMVSYVDSLKKEFKVIQIFHPWSCYDNPNTFPGEEPTANEGYAGDQYGNPRSARVTCLKHHWWWMMNTVWNMDIQAEAMFFTEEDYLVSPTIYQAIKNGLERMNSLSKSETSPKILFGIIMEAQFTLRPKTPAWLLDSFRSGPMVIQKSMWNNISKAAKEFCTFDEYNWDWTLVHLMNIGTMPRRVLAPSVNQVKHIGTNGLHGGHAENAERAIKPFITNQTAFQMPTRKVSSPGRGFGGWGHPWDQQHCLSVAHQFSSKIE